MADLKVVLTRRWPAAVEALLADEFHLCSNGTDEPMGLPQLQAAISDADVFCPTVSDVIDAQVLAAAPASLRLIANFGVGFNHIDIAAAQAQGTPVTNTPGVLTDCTADLAMTLLLMCARRAGEGERELRADAWHGWRPTHLMGSSVTGKTLGIIGAGRIGLAMARRAHLGFGMKVLLYTRSPLAEAQLAPLNAESVALNTLLERSDFVSLHCPSTPQTRHLIDAAALDRMPAHAMLINTARGDVVDEAALCRALESGVIRAAGLDVYEAEPALTAGLAALDNAVLLPHLGSATEETRTAMGMKVVDNIRALAAGEELPDLVS